MYECPNCGANLKFDIPSQQLFCGHCDTRIDPYAFQKEQDAEETLEVSDEYEVTVFTCPQCGGELISDDNTAATFCSFCGGATILDSRISREKRPGYIIPFQKTKEDCRGAYKKLLRRAIFAPGELKDEENIEHFRSIYMPYWIYSFRRNGHISFRGKKTRQSGDYEITKHYQLETDIDAEYRGLSFDASASFSDNLSNAIAPFAWKEAKPFTPAFLSGFYADTNDVSSEVYQKDAYAMVKKEIVTRLAADPVCKKYTLSGLDKALALEAEDEELAMFPVWFLAYRKNDRVSYAVVNGQTGEAAADLPIDRRRYLLGSLLLAIPIFVMLNLLVSMRAMTMLICTAALLVLGGVISLGQMWKLEEREAEKDDKGLKYFRSENKKKRSKKGKTVKPDYKKVLLKPAAGVLLVVAVILLKPVSDLYYYGAAMVAMGLMSWNITDIIERYNLLATRKLPQFNRRGGDENV